MATVRIPDEHFTKSVRRDYSEPDTALIREFIQNSVDAGATCIDITVDSEGVLTCADDGCGMSQTVLVDALLTLSGSYKGPNSVGGFGQAKALLIFQHDSYQIHTNNIKVEGKVLQYDLYVTDDVRKGTSITIKMADAHFSFHQFCYRAKDFLKSCQLDVQVTFNGEPIKSEIVRGAEVRDLGWGKIYAKKTKQHMNTCQVRIRGITMFSPYIGDIDQSIVIEITKPSTEILTVNRDGFTYEYSSKLQQLMQEIIIEKASFGAAYNLQSTWRGRDRAYDDATALAKKASFAIIEALRSIGRRIVEKQADVIHGDLMISEEEINAQVAAKAAAVLAESPGETSPERIASVYSSVARQVSTSLGLTDKDASKAVRKLNDSICDLNADFTVFVKGHGFNKIPVWLEPGKLGKRLSTLARLWKHCLKIVMSANEIQVPYAIGWVLDHEDKTEAMTLDKDGVRLFLLNPLLDWTKDYKPRESFMKMVMVAAHEVAHLERKYHDETFCIAADKILFRSLLSVDSWWNEYLAIKEEVI